MSRRLKDRVDRLERQVGALTKAADDAPRQRDWRSTFGLSANDSGFDEMIRLGREIRRQMPVARGAVPV
jgi:hypothetical protein